MRDDRVRELLDRPAPGEQEAEDRGWQVVRGAFAQRDVPARRTSRARPDRPGRGTRPDRFRLHPSGPGGHRLGARYGRAGARRCPSGTRVVARAREAAGQLAAGAVDRGAGRLAAVAGAGTTTRRGPRAGCSWPRPAAASWWRWIPGARHGGRSPGRHSSQSHAGRPTGSGSPTRAATTCGWSPGTGRATLHWPRTSRTRRPRGDPGRATGSLSSIDRGASTWSRPTPARRCGARGRGPRRASSPGPSTGRCCWPWRPRS